MNRRGLRLPLLLAVMGLAAGMVAVEAQPPAIEATGFHVFGANGNGGPFGVSVLCPNQLAPFTHWDLRQFRGCSVPYEVNGIIGVPGNPNAAQAAAAVNLAARTWTLATPAYINLFDNSAASPVACNRAPVFDGRNCIAWDPAFGFGANVLGVTFLWRNAPTGNMIESDITLNPVPAGFTWQASPPACGLPPAVPIGIETVVLHELGHFLGLGHPNQFSLAGCGNDDPGDTTVMFASYTNACEIALAQPDKDGVNYLYTADLGDLPDPPYATRVHSGVPSGTVLSSVALESPARGPEHLFGLYADRNLLNLPRYQYEWLAFRNGAIDDHPQECEARPVDNFDDGVSAAFQCVNGVIAGNIALTMHVKTARDVRGRTHAYGPGNAMYLNGWFDWNSDGDFQDPGEHAIGTGAGVAVFAAGAFTFQVAPPPNTPCTFNSRFRLDWREDVGQVLLIDGTLNREFGAAQHGEVEDYPGSIPRLHPPNQYCHPQKRIPVNFPGIGSRLFIQELCHPPQPVGIDVATSKFFPDAGKDCMNTSLCFKVDGNDDGVADEDLCLTGPVCVNRSAPYVGTDGLRTIDTEMVSLDVTGYSHFAGSLRIHLAPNTTSKGQIKQSQAAAEQGIDVSLESPAASYFDVVWMVESDLVGASEVVGPTRVEANISAVPPGETIDDPVTPVPGQVEPKH